MDREYEELLPRRALGEGHWDRRLKERMVDLSVADNYDDCKHEWIVTENVWYIPFGEDANVVLPDVHCHGENAHAHECLCGHPIVWHFEIENTENGNKQIVGSEHIESYMVIRYFEKKGYDPEAVTEEMIEEWIQERVKSLKAQWWWDLHGEQFTEWFEEIRELDLRVNQRRKGSVYSQTTRRYEPQYVIRKKAEGKFGQAGYKMASIVWRWNHPNNSRRQIETRGYPNERLWNDLQIFYITQQQYRQQIQQEDAEIARRVEELAEQDRLAEVRRRERDEEYRRQRIEREKRMEERRMQEAELEGIQEEKRLANLMKNRLDAESAETTFVQMCEYYDVPVFTRDNGANDWERRFLGDLIIRMGQGKNLSNSQLNHLRNIVVDEPLPATDKQIWYIQKLAGDDFEIPEGLNRVTASELISMLKEEE
tara:strand:- start:5727 stop:7001 length:1275 start_codon:yes stop_codon:yes gene_type:complete